MSDDRRKYESAFKKSNTNACGSCGYYSCTCDDERKERLKLPDDHPPCNCMLCGKTNTNGMHVAGARIHCNFCVAFGQKKRD